MSAVNDATQVARDAVAAADATIAGLAAQLAAVPGWLRVGDPLRHADPGDRGAAEAAVTLAGRLARARTARDRLADGVEQALGGAPDQIFAWVTMRAWLEGLADADALLGGLAASPERLLTAEAAMPRATAEAILGYIAANGGHVGDGEAFRQGVPLDAADLADLVETGWRLRRGAGDPACWDVLLPVRLETRFLPPGKPGPNPGSDTTQWRLLVRVEPDAPAMASRPAPVRRDEAALVAGCWAECAGSLDGDAGSAAFGKLAHRLGAARAAFLLRTVPVVRADTGFAAAAFPERPDPAPPPLVALPSTLEIWGGPEDAPALLATLNPDRDAMAATATIEAVATPDADGETPRRWWNAYRAAADVGLATEIPLGADAPAFPVLLCVGYDGPGAVPVDPAELLGLHVDSGRAGWVAPLTPTNTVAGAPTADLGGDPAPWLAAVRGAPGAMPGLAGTAGFWGLPEPDATRAALAASLVRALWPLLWQRAFKDTGDGSEEIWRLGEWAGRHLHAFGPFPVLRVGDLPYGLLPVGAYDRWAWRKPVANLRAGDPRPEALALAGLPLLTEPLLRLARDQGTAAGADTDRILDLLEQVPTSRAYGSRQIPATVLLDALSAALGASNPGDRVREWEAQFAALRAGWPPGPRRRYSPALEVEPFPDKVDPDFRKLLRVFLDVSWSRLAETNDPDPFWRFEGLPPATLARLVRQALLLTQAEVARLVPSTPPGFLLPLDRVEVFIQLASGGELAGPRVGELPDWAKDQLRPFGDDPRAAVVCRQFEDVRDAVLQLSEADPAEAERVLPAVVDLSSHRVDAWWTGLAARRLATLAAAGGKPRLGCYGWVDDLAPNPDPTPPTTAGLLHAPGYAQALAAAVLRDQAVHHADATRWDITLESARIRAAVGLAEQVKAGVHLSEALGREIERRVGEPGKVLALREAFPARPEWSGRRVCDGQQVLDAGAALPAEIDGAGFDDLRLALDAYADLLVGDALHDLVAGRAPAAAEALEASAGLGAPPELRLLRTQRGGSTVRTTVEVALPWSADWDEPEAMDAASPVAIADPALAGLLARELPPAAAWTWTAGDRSVTLAALGLAVSDVPMFAPGELASVAAKALGTPPDGGTAGANHARGAAICAALGGGALPEGAATALRGRLARLRALAGDVVAALALPDADPAAVRPWGLDEADASAAAEALAARLAALGDVADDAAASAATLAERIRQLLPAALALTLAVPQPATPAAGPLDDGWLEVVAAVRPALARLEVAQLTADAAWPATLVDALPAWAPGDTPGAHRALTVTFRPPTPPDAVPGVAATVAVDGWGETIPARTHSTWAAFGYDAPRARPPQAILLAVPADVDAPDPPADIRGAVLSARRLARVRGLRQPLAPEVGLVLPTSMVIDDVVTRAGAALTGES